MIEARRVALRDVVFIKTDCNRWVRVQHIESVYKIGMRWQIKTVSGETYWVTDTEDKFKEYFFE